MDAVLTTKINDVDKLIESGQWDKTVAVLKELAHAYPREGVVAYYLGRACVVGADGMLALKYFTKAIDLGYATTEVYLSTAMVQKNFGVLTEAEKSLLKATEVADTTDLIWVSLSCLAVFYLQTEMYLKADKIAKRLRKEFPDNYQGYHLHILVEAMREHYEEVFAYMDMVPEIFKENPQYLIDTIEIYKKAGEEAELAELFETDLRFSRIIPQIVLREKITATPNDEYDDTKEKLIRQLAMDYHDKDAVVSVMILEFSRKNFKKASQIASVVLDNEKENQGFRYYLALYFQMYNLYYLAEKKPSEELRNWIEKAGNWCMDFADQLGISEARETVNTSIQELFDEINAVKV